jgi:hypothetical protein
MSPHGVRPRRIAIAPLALAGLVWLGGSARAADPAAARRIEALEEQLREAQVQLKDLKAALDRQQAANEANAKRIEATNQTVAESAKKTKTVSLPDWLDRTTVFGDVRYRHEGFYHQPRATGQVVTARNRERIRARLGVRVAFSDELSATIRGASGSVNDPISTNETLTGDFTRKSFNLDWAYLTFSPGKSFGLRPGVATLTAGKFPNPIFRVDELVFDEDLSAEGLSETVQLLGRPIGPLDQVKVHALQWTFAEIANEQDGWMFGGQVNPSLHLGNVQLEAGLGQYWWLNPDLIAQALSRNTTAFTSSGAPVANSGFNSALGNTNLLVTKTIQPPTPKGGKKPASFTAITGYRSGFDQSNVTLQATIPNVVAAQPLRFWFDWVHNWLAASDDAYGWQGGIRLGQTKAKGDWSVYGFYEHLGQEATISSFTWSDFGNGGTNQAGPGIGIDYQLLGPLTVSAKSSFTNSIGRRGRATRR